MELPACPVETTLMLIGDKWKVLILRDLMSGTKRFGELKARDPMKWVGLMNTCKAQAEEVILAELIYA